ITAEAAAALEAAHKLGFVHRDVKPANIMLEGEERRVLLMDFGIAKAAAADEAAITGTGVIIGSPAYMSPEQSRGERDVDGRSDIYSLGAVAYEMLSGVRPLIADSLHELVYKQVTEDVLDVAERVPNLPAHVGKSVMRCLAKDREHRWQTAADLRKSLSTSAGTSSLERHGEPDEESWLSLRGPYVLLLGFLLYFSEIFARLMNIRTAELLYDDWRLFAYARNGVWVLLLAAAIDLGVRIAVRVSKGRSWSQVVRFLLGQPDWWQTWYPRPLRVRDSVWDRLTFGMKALRTLAWFQWMLLPFGSVVVLFVLPTFRSLARDSGIALPLSLRAFNALVVWSSYALFGTLALLWWQLRQARIKHNVPMLAFLRSLLNLRGSYWQGSPARAMLRD
ncbi:MAG TPA: serine/threonine-protein kinase, partial [Gemmatimonadaceae bacterium]|nr:serine/threonine-protein kinase [Gemmatimonadaceae bacterium]